MGIFFLHFTQNLFYKKKAVVLYYMTVLIYYLNGIHFVLLEVLEGAGSHTGIPAAQRGEFTSFSHMPEQNKHS